MIITATEQQEQAAVIEWSLLTANKYPELWMLYHIPNGGKRDPIEAKHLQQAGVRRGVPDLCLPVARGQYHGLYIEMKSEGGKTSPEQDDWIEALTEQGHYVEVCHGWESAVRVIEWYLKLKGKTT